MALTAGMLNIDRHIAIWAGWVAGPAFGVAMMAAPEYLHLGSIRSGILFWSSIGVFVTTVVVVAILSLHEKRRQHALIGPVLVMGLSALAFCGGAAWYFWPIKTEAAGETSPLDGQLQISSGISQYPTVLPQHTIFELQLNNNFSIDGGAFLGWTLPAGSPLPPRDQSVMPNYGVRLRIQNFGKIAVVNTRIAFPIEFMAILKNDNGISSGEVIKSTALTTIPFSIGPGEVVDIYAMNYSADAFAKVLTPQTAQGYLPGSDKLETFKLIPPTFSGMVMEPFAPKPKPRLPESPPVPLPPLRPR
jgi:hypothetical protein